MSQVWENKSPAYPVIVPVEGDSEQTLFSSLGVVCLIILAICTFPWSLIWLWAINDANK